VSFQQCVVVWVTDVWATQVGHFGDVQHHLRIEGWLNVRSMMVEGRHLPCSALYRGLSYTVSKI